MKTEIGAGNHMRKVLRLKTPEEEPAVTARPIVSEEVRLEAGVAVKPPWVQALSEPATKSIFLHIHKHGSITESEATAMLGSPRKFRKFSLNFEEHCKLLPFEIRIEQMPDGKRYVKEGRSE